MASTSIRDIKCMRGLAGFTALMATVACNDIASSTQRPVPPEATRLSLETVDSTRDFAATIDAAKAAMERRGFRIFTEIDHAAGARSIEATLSPTTVILFGNPKGGTPLIQAERSIAIDLPLRMLVMESAEGEVQLAWTPVDALFARHGLEAMAGPKAKIASAFAAIAEEAAGQ